MTLRCNYRLKKVCARVTLANTEIFRNICLYRKKTTWKKLYPRTPGEQQKSIGTQQCQNLDKSTEQYLFVTHNRQQFSCRFDCCRRWTWRGFESSASRRNEEPTKEACWARLPQMFCILLSIFCFSCSLTLVVFRQNWPPGDIKIYQISSSLRWSEANHPLFISFSSVPLCFGKTLRKLRQTKMKSLQSQL